MKTIWKLLVAIGLVITTPFLFIITIPWMLILMCKNTYTFKELLKLHWQTTVETYQDFT